MSQILLIRKRQRLRVHAKPQTRRRGAVFEHVAEMTIAAGAQDLKPVHAVAVIAVRADVLLSDGLKEARPASAGIELSGRGEQRQATTDAGVNSVALIIEQ